MKNSKINQELENIINLMGEHVSFVKNVKISGQFLSQKIEGKLTHIVLDLHGDYQFSVDDGDFYSFSELTEFKILCSDPVADAFEALITDNKDFIDSLSKSTL